MTYEPAKNEILFNFYYCLFKQKYLMLATFLVVLLSVLGGVFLMTPGYKATATLWVHKNPKQNIQFFRDIEMPAINFSPISGGINLIEVLVGYEVAAHIVRTYGLDEKFRKINQEPETARDKFWYYFGEVFSFPFDLIDWSLIKLGLMEPEEEEVDWFAKAVERVRNDWFAIEMHGTQTDILGISVWADDPVLSLEIVQELVDVIMQKTIDMKQNQARDALNFAEKQVQRYEAELHESSTRLQKFLKENGITDLQSEKTSRLALLEKYVAEMYEVEKILVTQEAQNKKLEDLIAQQEEKFVSLVLYQRQKQEQYDLEVSIHSNRSRLEEIEVKKRQLDAEIARLNALEVDYQNLVRQKKNKMLLLADFDRKFDELSVQVVSHLNEFGLEVIDPPYLKKGVFMPANPDWFVNILLALFMALVSAVTLPFFVEYWNESIRTENDLERYLRSSALASFPMEGRILKP
jgi:uncharacterized protein involved in exopolysaccharide biosynthesis